MIAVTAMPRSLQGRLLALLLPAVLASLVFISFGFLGLVVPTTAVMALDHHGEMAGTASALMGTLQFTLGALTSGIVSLLHGDPALSMGVIVAVCGLSGLAARQAGNTVGSIRNVAVAALAGPAWRGAYRGR